MRIIIFGYGEIGKKLVQEIKHYSEMISIVAVMDNNPNISSQDGMRITSPESIKEYDFDEIWITTVYYEEIMNQLDDEGIDRAKMHFVEPTIPIIEERIRKSIAGGQTNALFPAQIDEELLSYLSTHKLKMYCYPFCDEYLGKNPQIHYDKEADLYYGIFEGKKMYLSRKYHDEQKARAYFNAVTMEQDIRSPHCYWNEDNLINARGCVVDVGAAEGIFGLKIIENIDHLYMIEADSDWAEALRYTYRDYANKVTIIEKYASDCDEDKCIRIDSFLKNEPIDVIKMDIEGMEMKALVGAERIIDKDCPVIAVCVYHHRNDNNVISKWLMEKGYCTRNSHGYVVCMGDWELERDEAGFRKALLFAHKA